ncbi:MAG TPA: AbrB/MazE/SpoVT family DNA-binding domain-containing protein [Candidatus Dormibacteraeota bacterium]|nr:AbrB/MazE/SpoVT family DNA-binding domain-containing protein [Candidatus Dormibacteraeota bacterium]
MQNSSYTLKVSSQSQVTLPRDLRERLKLRPGSRITIMVTENGNLKLSDKLPIEKHFGTLSGTWTTQGQDVASYTRTLRNSMQPKLTSEER